VSYVVTARIVTSQICLISPQWTIRFSACCRFHGLIWTLRVPPGIIKHIMQQALVLRLWQNGLSVKGNKEGVRNQAFAATAVPVNVCQCITRGFFARFQPFQLAWVLTQKLLGLLNSYMGKVEPISVHMDISLYIMDEIRGCLVARVAL